MPTPNTSANRGRAVAIIGSVMLFAPLITLAMTVQSVMRALEKAMDGASEEAVMASVRQDSQNAFAVTTVCLCVSLLGIALVLTACWKFRYARPWLWWTLLLAPVFPLSLWYLMIPWVVAVLWNRKKFFAPRPSLPVVMPRVLIIHEVADFPAWKKIFNRAAGIRRAAGERAYQVLKDEKDPNRIVHFSSWTSLEAARTFFESPQLVQIRLEAGVKAPEFHYLELVEAGEA